ncbi:hypothetical protein UFOVP505_3 [uncultured Caudovirales phage]|uniref:Uncharacterized protein n=1 Tax=uncultured Caudovirales phage TaxID=2100421 RepID=A0A6J5MPA7_9CAUD|nr:hypothetical protein UFOVP505_3 [uncultured Caudovirales phage]
MATLSKTLGTLYALASTAASSVSLGTPLDVSTKMGGLVYVRFGRRSATAAGAGCNIRLEASHSSSADNSWYPFAIFTTAFAAAEAEAVSGTVAAGATAITVAATANLTQGDIIFIDNGTIGNSEWGRIKSISLNTSVTVEDALVNAATGCTLYDSAEIYAPVAIPEGASRIRCVVDASAFTQACAVEARYTTVDGIA